VKEIKTTALTPKQKAATMDEVEVLAKLDHPNIGARRALPKP
jgi:hypothetical protein